MKRALSGILAVLLALGSVPASAQSAAVRLAADAGVSAPVPLPSGIVPAAGAFVPALSAPALAASLTPAPFAPLGDSPSPAPKAVAPFVPPARVPGLVPSEIPVPGPRRGAGATPSRTALPLDDLRTAAIPGDAALVFDGGRTLSAAATPEVPGEPGPAAAPAKKGLLARYRENRGKPPTPFSTFGKAMTYAAMTAVALPILAGAAPAMKALYGVIAADALLFLLLLPASALVWAAGKLRRAPQTAAKPPPGRALKAAVVALGIVLGLGVGLAPYTATGRSAESVSAYLDRGRGAGEQERARWIRGGTMESETVKVLSANPVGRDTLNALRDRFGVLRLPTFFISRQQDSYAQHENFFDGVYINESEITDRGWTVDQFLKDPALQARLVREMDSTITHELTHAVQGRRPPWTPGYFKNTTESEQEAFFQEALFLLAKLEADPGLRNVGHDQWLIIDAADGIDGFLAEVAAMYPKNSPVGKDPYFNAYLAAQRARWPEFRVHIYQVLAARANAPRTAKMYMDKAKAAAKEAGLPEPQPLPGTPAA